MAQRLFIASGVALTVAACTLFRPAPPAQDCAGWSRLDIDAREQTAAALIQPWLLDRARERQHLPPGTPDGEVFQAVASSITKTCDLERRPDLLLAQVVRDLYENS
jgi:hypothetical protein